MKELPQPVRILRITSPRRRWVLDDGTGLFDLSEYLRQAGRPDDLLELSEDGWFSPDQLEAKLPRSGQEGWQQIDLSPGEEPEGGWGLPLPLGSVGKILALGKNFRAHAEEFHEAVPEEPLYFNKLPETLIPSGQAVTIPHWYQGRVDHEVELCVVIGLKGRNIAEEDAMEHVAFYTLANDLTARSLQGSDRKLGYPWFRAKNMDGFCPLGPALVPQGYLDPNNLDLSATVRGEVRQQANTRDFVVSIPAALAYLSRHLTLNRGDLLLMGTPSGVGALENGDEVLCVGEPIGTLRTTILRP